ncbi:hypothetical protein E2C01_041144 [Portunus trituberculatus]|uniref:Uncharacterized protein n=1 Tax=Portunus trituberculatus TaxID=210409 RepID=A0A5B7FQ52_PORTR|nr:hypothetical protein [Portunus trituberculatus]
MKEVRPRSLFSRDPAADEQACQVWPQEGRHCSMASRLLSRYKFMKWRQCGGVAAEGHLATAPTDGPATGVGSPCSGRRTLSN